MSNEIIKAAVSVVARPDARATITEDKYELLRHTLVKDASNAEFDLFVQVCNRTGLDPFARQIFAVSRYDKNAGGKVMTIQTSIDGHRLIAERSGKYAGQLGPFWCGKDGQWREVWLEDQPPAAARVGVLRHDFKEPVWRVARWNSYVQKGKEGAPSKMWAAMPDVMLAKCAESLALRTAFPQELSGLYTQEEMAQSETVGESLPSHLVDPAPSQQQLEGSRPPQKDAPPKTTTSEQPRSKTSRLIDLATYWAQQLNAGQEDRPAFIAYAQSRVQVGEGENVLDLSLPKHWTDEAFAECRAAIDDDVAHSAGVQAEERAA
jgi:phage recombination protein Bet